SRLNSYTYPAANGVSDFYKYAAGLDSRISRVSGNTVVTPGGSSTIVLGLYYLGLGTIVWNSNPVTFRTYIGAAPGEAGDKYVGLVRFGRVADLTWSTGGSGGAVNDHFIYGYDRDSNRRYRTNELNHDFDELYH